MDSQKYVCLEGLKEGNRFFTTNTPGEDPTKLFDGTVAYKVLGYADTVEGAQKILYGDMTVEEHRAMIADYLFTSGRGFFDRPACEDLAFKLFP